MPGSDVYQIEYLESVIKEDISKIPNADKNIIKKAIEERLSIDPIGFGKPLRYSLKGHRRLRVSTYRIIYRIVASTKIVLIIAIKHRKDIYKNS
jgi:mRNA interferase RelE/StbE